MKKLIIPLLFILAFPLLAQTDKDTVWTKDLSPETITGAKFTPDGTKIVVTTKGKIRVYDTESGEVLKNYDVGNITQNIYRMDINPDGRYIVTGDDLYKIVIWDIETGDTVKTLLIINGLIKCVNYAHNNNEILVTAYIQGNLNFIKWKIDNDNTLTKQISDIESIYTVTISKDDIYFVTGHLNHGWIVIWNYDTMTNGTLLGYHESDVMDVDFSPDGKYLASAGHDGYVKVWDINKRELYKSFFHDSSSKDVETVKFSNNSKYIVSGQRVGIGLNNLKIWDFEKENLIKKYIYGPLDLDINFDNKYIITTNSVQIFLLNAIWKPNNVIEEEPKDTIILYPNPFHDYLTIYIIGNNKPETINIYDLFGRIVLTQKVEYIESLKTQHITLNTENLPQGVYIVRVQGSPGARAVLKVE